MTTILLHQRIRYENHHATAVTAASAAGTAAFASEEDEDRASVTTERTSCESTDCFPVVSAEEEEKIPSPKKSLKKGGFARVFRKLVIRHHNKTGVSSSSLISLEKKNSSSSIYPVKPASSTTTTVKKTTTAANSSKTCSKGITSTTSITSSSSCIPVAVEAVESSASLTSPPSSPVTTTSPQDSLDALLQERGYKVIRYESLHTGYYNSQPTAYQVASFHPRLLKLLSSSNQPQCRQEFQALFTSGLSPNPFNSHTREYLVHTVCSQNAWKVLNVMIQHGGTQVVQVADDLGRTPLHIVCASNASNSPMHDDDLKETLVILLECDVQLLYMTDCRQAEPLSYIQKEHYQDWIEFIQSVKDTFWPPLKSVLYDEDDDEASSSCCCLAKKQPNSVPLPLPTNGTTEEVVSLLASGRMHPEDVLLFCYKATEEHEGETTPTPTPTTCSGTSLWNHGNDNSDSDDGESITFSISSFENDDDSDNSDDDSDSSIDMSGVLEDLQKQL